MASFALGTGAVAGAETKSVSGKASATLAQGQIAYRSTSTGLIALARANAQATAQVLGVIRQSVTVGGPVDVQTAGIVTGLSGLVVGGIYVLADDVAGSVMLASELGTGDWVAIIGVALTATTMLLTITPARVQAA